jgi:methionine-rich copper-binding protein CopC
MHTRSIVSRRCVATCALVVTVAVTVSGSGTRAWAHAFVTRSEPRTGATVVESPARVRIWFDGPVEPLFAKISVENRDKRRVDNGDGRVNPDDPRLLEVGLPPLPPGRYRVTWSVIARDGHAREGSFSFLLK